MTADDKFFYSNDVAKKFNETTQNELAQSIDPYK